MLRGRGASIPAAAELTSQEEDMARLVPKSQQRMQWAIPATTWATSHTIVVRAALNRAQPSPCMAMKAEPPLHSRHSCIHSFSHGSSSSLRGSLLGLGDTEHGMEG